MDLACTAHGVMWCTECTAAWAEKNWPRLINRWAANYQAELQAECQEAHDLTLEENRITDADHRHWTQPWQTQGKTT